MKWRDGGWRHWVNNGGFSVGQSHTRTRGYRPSKLKYWVAPAAFVVSLMMLTSCAEVSLNRLKGRCEERAQTQIFAPELWVEYVELIRRSHRERAARGVSARFDIQHIGVEYKLIHEQEFFGKTMEWSGSRPQNHKIVRDNVSIVRNGRLVAILENYIVLYSTIEASTFESCLNLTPELYIERQSNA